MIVMTEVKNPDLARVDEVGLASLAPGVRSRHRRIVPNLSTVELSRKASRVNVLSRRSLLVSSFAAARSRSYSASCS